MVSVYRVLQYVLLGVSVLLIGACAPMHVKPVNWMTWNMAHPYIFWDDTPPTTAGMMHVEVKAEKVESLQQYQTEMLTLFRVPSLDYAYIGCVGCEKLIVQQPPPAKLDYYYMQQHTDRDKFFARARDNVNAMPGLRVEMSNKGPGSPGAGACPPVHPPGYNCVAAPYCVATDACDKISGPPCQRCI